MKGLSLLALVGSIGAVLSQDCNICGDGNSIQFPQGSVEFVYKGQNFKNNCEHWQKTVKNPVAISDHFCRNELPQYTVKTCRCTDPDGNQVVWGAPSAAPSPGSAAVEESDEEKSEEEKRDEEKSSGSMADSSFTISTSIALVGILTVLGMQL